MSVQMDPHAGQKDLTAGPPPERAAATVVMIHGRGASAESILSLQEAFGLDDLAAVAPQAAGHTWYPQSFLAPMERNQPWLDSALRRIDGIVTELIARGIRSEKIALLGFSQGACLTAEYVARHPRKYGAALVLTGGVIGPPGTPREYAGSLAGTPVFIGTSDPDPHVPVSRVAETQAALEKLGAAVELRIYSGMPHTVNPEEVEICREYLERMMAKE